MMSTLKVVLLSVIGFLTAFLLVSMVEISPVKVSSSMGIKVCPGSGHACALWGAIEKGEGKGFVDAEKDEKAEPNPEEESSGD